jgi:hypothetical protein
MHGREERVQQWQYPPYAHEPTPQGGQQGQEAKHYESGAVAQ